MSFSPVTGSRRLSVSHGLAWPILLLLILAGTLIGLPFLFFARLNSDIEENNVDGPAPNASYAIRRAWGENKLQHHFVRVDEWVRQSNRIADDIGTVTGVAPIGSPNSFRAYFGESSARMNLQVIGEKGEGVLYLPDVCADDPGILNGVYIEKGSWTFMRTEGPEPRTNDK